MGVRRLTLLTHRDSGGKKKESKFEGSEVKAKAEEKEIVKRALAMLHSKTAPEPLATAHVQDERVEAREVREGQTIQAVKICSRVLEDEIWLILDGSFILHDGIACYYAEEIPLLKNKTHEELREIHKVKLSFPGCRVIQEGPERIAEAQKEGQCLVNDRRVRDIERR